MVEKARWTNAPKALAARAHRAVRDAPRAMGASVVAIKDEIRAHVRDHPRGSAIFAAALLAQTTMASASLDRELSWDGVPPPPSVEGAAASTLGDRQLAYRAHGLALQHMGDFGGRVRSLTDYDYVRIGGWLEALDPLDAEAVYLPALAAHYFASTPNPADLPPIVDYLENVADRAPEARWRFLAHAVHIAKHRMKDLPRALELATKLAGLEGANAPIWTKQMPAFVLAELGEEEEAADLMRAILASDPDVSPGETIFMQRFIEETPRRRVR